MGQSVVCESHTKTRNLLQKFRSALRLTSASSDVTRELVRMWLRHADYSMLCNVWGGDRVGHISFTEYFWWGAPNTLKVVYFGALLSTPQRWYWNFNYLNLYTFRSWLHILQKKKENSLFWISSALSNFKLFSPLKIHRAATFFLVDLLSNNLAYDI
jgi:hypothetical protein